MEATGSRVINLPSPQVVFRQIANRAGWGMSLASKVAWCVFAALLWHPDLYSAAAQPEPYHPNCLAAFENLPVSKLGHEAIERDERGAEQRVANTPAALADHFNRHADAYKAYDAACFFPFLCREQDPIRCPSATTAAFVKAVIGVLFIESSPGEFHPYCSAFRISATLIATAAHCVKPLMHFRLAGDPAKILEVHASHPDSTIGTPNADLTDYAILSIEKSPISITLSKSDFLRTTIERQAINVIALSMPAYRLGQHVPNDWLQAVRFSRLNAARLWSFSEAAKTPGSSGTETDCLIYRAPTFAGMSGAPILAIRRPSREGGTPKIFIVGIHLRNGHPPSKCGAWADFNVGIRIPQAVLDRVK